MSHPLLARLASPDAAERRAACAAAPDDPSAVLLVDALVGALGDADRSVARAAVEALAAIGLRDRGVDAALRRPLRRGTVEERFGAACVLARLSPPGPHLLPALVDALDHRFGDVRWTAARMLVDLGRLHGEVLGILVGLTGGDGRPRVRRMAAFALRELSPDHPACARALVDATGDEDRSVKRAALTALASLVDPPGFVAERLLAALRGDPDPACRRIATVALGELGRAHPGWLPAEAAAELFALAAASRDSDLRRGAARALSRLERTPTPEGAGR